MKPKSDVLNQNQSSNAGTIWERNRINNTLDPVSSQGAKIPWVATFSLLQTQALTHSFAENLTILNLIVKFSIRRYAQYIIVCWHVSAVNISP